MSTAVVERELQQSAAELTGEALLMEVVASAEELYDRSSEASHVLHEVIGTEPTPLKRAQAVPMSGHTLLLKNETVHDCQAYKVRGVTYAAYKAQQVNPFLETLVVPSAGNHAKGAVQAGKVLGLGVSAHLSRFASAKKQADLTAAGATLTNHYESLEAAMEGAKAEATADPWTKVEIPPFDHPDVMAGQSTILQETFNQLRAQDYDLRHDQVDILLPAGGKGMAAGCLAWADRELKRGNIGQNVRFHLVEVVGKENTAWCDGTYTADGQKTTDVLETVSVKFDTIYVTETELAQSMQELTREHNKTIEPAGALATAGAKKHAAQEQYQKSHVVDGKLVYDAPVRTYVAVVSGANIDAPTLERAKDLRTAQHHQVLAQLSLLHQAGVERFGLDKSNRYAKRLATMTLGNV